MILIRKPAKKTTQPKGEGLCRPGPRSELSEEFASDFNTYRCMGNVGNIIAIDPGLNGTGWAVFDREYGPDPKVPIESGSIDSDKDMPWWLRAKDISYSIYNIGRRHNCFVLYIEQPKFYESSGAGLSAARDGDLVKLSILCGMIMGAFISPGGGSGIVVPVHIADWKGQMDKKLCAERIYKRLPKLKPTTKTSHEMDAIGIGLFVKGWF